MRMVVTLIDGQRVEVDEKLIEKYKIDKRTKTPFSHLPIEDKQIIEDKMSSLTEEAEENIYDGWDA